MSQEVWVLGCGPSLQDIEIPNNVLTIGTNDSYLVHWSPIYATTDKDALRRDYPNNLARALIYYTAIDPGRPDPPIERLPGRPLESIHRPERPTLRKSGVFAYWLAIHAFNATRVHLVGMDMGSQGHFDGAVARDRVEQTYKGQKLRLKEIQAETGVESWIWRGGGFIPVQSLHTTAWSLDPKTFGKHDSSVINGMTFVKKPPRDYMKKEQVGDGEEEKELA